nr:beta-glucosidase BglX [uncultured Carboxylicivirga sp.]
MNKSSRVLLLTSILMSLIWLSGCELGINSTQSIQAVFIDSLMSQMTFEEKLGQLNLLVWDGSLQTGSVKNTGVSEKVEKGLVGGLFNIETKEERKNIQQLAVEKSRLGIPLLFGQDVIHGHKTVFPIPLGLSCSWDMELIQLTAKAAAIEASADGIDWVFSPMVDISRDPRWGRVAEGAGEDPYLGSLIAQAMVNGYQGNSLNHPESVMACVKHFALYGAAEAGRDYNSVDMSEIKMHQVYLPPYKAAVDAGVESVMTAFNDVNGIPATGNKKLFNDLLRDKWGFNGFVVTDYTAINEMGNHGLGNLSTTSTLAMDAGIDMDMVGEGFLNTLKNSVEKGTLLASQVDQACRRILEAKYSLGLFDDPFIRLKEERRHSLSEGKIMDLAYHAALQSCVLLKNDQQVLPFKTSQKIAIVGPLADSKEDILGTWVLNGDLDKTLTVLEALRNRTEVFYSKGAEITNNVSMAKLINYQFDPKNSKQLQKEAIDVASKSDVIIAVLGENAQMNGEAASLADINIQESQQNLLKELYKIGKPIVLVLINGRPLTLEWESKHCSAILECWSGGTQGGKAIADILFGDYNPSGKLTMSFPRSVGQIPLYYNYKTTGRPFIEQVKYTSRYLDVPNTPLFPFGYGLSYTTFEYGDITLNSEEIYDNDTLVAYVEIKNTGMYEGVETSQLYIRDMVATVTRPIKELKGFKKVKLRPGESKVIEFRLTVDDLKFCNADLEWVYEPGDFMLEIGTNSQNTKQKSFRLMD